MSGKKSTSSPPPPWRKRLAVALVLIVGLSIGARVYLDSQEPAPAQATAQSGTSGGSGGTANALLPGEPDPRTAPQEPQADESQAGARKALPFVTEGGIAMLLGLALGVATRAVARLLMVLVAITFITIQFLAFKGALTVDWEAMEKFVFNIPAATGLGEVVKYKLPSAGALVLGYYLGLKKG